MSYGRNEQKNKEIEVRFDQVTQKRSGNSKSKRFKKNCVI